MKKEHKQKLKKILNDITKLIQDIDDSYGDDYKRFVCKNLKRKRGYKVYDRKKRTTYPSIKAAVSLTGHVFRYIKNHPELYIIEEV